MRNRYVCTEIRRARWSRLERSGKPSSSAASRPPRSSESTIKARAAGARALLLECDDAGHAATVAAALLRRRNELGADDVVAGAATVLAEGEGLDRSRVEAAAGQAEDAVEAETRAVDLTVVFDGPDLPPDAGELVAHFCAAPWTVGFLGFAPGFGYLMRSDVIPGSPLYLPRRDEPRTEVPAGSVALAAGYAAIYPRRSPGGWNLVGTFAESERLFDPVEGALFDPGMHVRFHARLT